VNIIRWRNVLAFLLMGIVLGFGVLEHLYRRIIEHRYEQAVIARRQVESEYAQMLAASRRHVDDVSRVRLRADTLTEQLADRNQQLEVVQGQLQTERLVVREMEARLGDMEIQLEELQGELAMVLRTGGQVAYSADGDTVQLERIVISEADAPGIQGRVVSVDRDWDFVVIDMGWDLVKIGDTVSIRRNDQLLAQAKVERIQERISAATVLPDWDIDGIEVNNVVSPQ
jgi:hypothetical protein